MVQSFLFINSSDTFLSSTPHDIQVQLNLDASWKKYNKLALKKVSFMNGRYNIHSGNKTIVFQEDGTASDLTATLTEQNYTAAQLATEIASKMTTASANTITCSYDSQTFKFTISTDGTSLKLTSGTTCLKELGFTAQTSFTNTSITSDLVVRLDGTQYVDVISNSLHSINKSTNDRSILARIPVQAAVGELVVWEANELVFHDFSSDQVQSLNMRLQDDQGNSFTLPANCSVQYTFVATY